MSAQREKERGVDWMAIAGRALAGAAPGDGRLAGVLEAPDMATPAIVAVVARSSW